MYMCMCMHTIYRCMYNTLDTVPIHIYPHTQYMYAVALAPICTRMHVNKNACIHTQTTHTCVHAHTYCTYTWTCIHTCTCTVHMYMYYTHVDMYMYTQMHMHAHTHECTRAHTDSYVARKWRQSSLGGSPSASNRSTDFVMASVEDFTRIQNTDMHSIRVNAEHNKR